MITLLLIAAAALSEPRGAQLLMQHPRSLSVTVPPAPITLDATNANQRLAWNAVQTPGLAGYRLYYGTNAARYSSTNTLGNVTTAVASNLVRGATYYFAVTDYLTNGLESTFSVPLAVTVPWYPPATNVVTLAVRVWSRPSTAEPWVLFATLPAASVTNPTDTRYFQCDMAIVQTNLSKQVLRLDSTTLVITNR